VCTFCGGAFPTVTFRNDSHAFPAALGNRDLLSNEECDGCNALYASSDEPASATKERD
jgi:hypothetical protein